MSGRDGMSGFFGEWFLMVCSFVVTHPACYKCGSLMVLLDKGKVCPSCGRLVLLPVSKRRTLDQEAYL